MEAIGIEGYGVLSAPSSWCGGCRVVVVVVATAVVVATVGPCDDQRTSEVGRKGLGAFHGGGSNVGCSGRSSDGCSF